MNYETIKEALETEKYGYIAVADVIDYLDTCVAENYDINGETTLPFKTMAELINTYLEGINFNNYQFSAILLAANDKKSLLKALKREA